MVRANTRRIFAKCMTLICISLLLFGCGEGELSPLGNAGGDDNNNGNAEPAAEAADIPQADEPDIFDQPDVVVEVVEEPVSDPENLDLVGECEPYSVECTADLAGILRCSRIGEYFDPSYCEATEICVDDDDDVRCETCTEGVNCRDDVAICDPGVDFCLDFQTAAECTSEGLAGTTQGCSGRCFDGACSNSGNETGEACDLPGDCIGQACFCAPGGGPCPIGVADGFCTTIDCQENGCDPSTEICADFSLSDAFGGENFCILRENCENRLGQCQVGYRGNGLVCRELPTPVGFGNRREWDLGCWVPPPGDPDDACSSADFCLAPIGGACDSEDTCVGGECWDLSEYGVNLSYCAATCDETHECPSYAECVRVTEGSDQHYCLARATAEDCPRMSPFGLVSVSLRRLGDTSSAQVCFVNE